jgi:DNA-binding response OmpR family regulator
MKTSRSSVPAPSSAAPVATQGADSRSQPLRPAAAAPAAPCILLVDDDPAIREGLERVLASEGWRVVTAGSGAEALEILADGQPDLMITDLRMADVSGWDLLFHENLQRPALPIFVITALPSSDVGGADRFAAAFFPKPLDLDALLAAIHRRLRSGAAPARPDPGRLTRPATRNKPPPGKVRAAWES